MKPGLQQPLLIALAVLLPFAALIAWGLWPSTEKPAPAPAEHPVARPPAPADDSHPAAANPLPPGPVAQPMPPPTTLPGLEPAQPEPTDAGAAARADPDASPAHQAALTAVAPLVAKCVDEHRAELSSKVQLRIGFDVLPTGAMRRPHVKMAPLDPYLQACLEDLFEETTLDVSNGVPEGQVQGTFDFDPAQERR